MTPAQFNELRAKAEAGNARAQYMLAAALSAAGQRLEADKWLSSAAALGEPDAGYTLATRQLQSIAGAEAAAGLLGPAADKGSNAARRLLGVLMSEGIGVARDPRKAAALVVEAAKSGDPQALRELAVLLLANDDEDETGITLLEKATESDPVGGAYYIRRTIEGKPHTDKSHAQGLLEKLAAARYPHAPALKTKLHTSPETSSGKIDAPVDWDAVAAKLSAADAFNRPPPETLSASPRANIFRAAFSPEECEYVIAIAAARLAPSLTVDPRTGETRRDEYRTSQTATLGPVDLDLVLTGFNHRLAKLAGRPPENGEFLSVLHYAPGQEYKPHSDWLPPGEDFNRGGQRVTTALLYLNDDYEGGETHFLAPDVRFKGRPGDVLVFENALASGEPDKASRHASIPVTAGTKWLGSKWFREKKYNF